MLVAMTGVVMAVSDSADPIDVTGHMNGWTFSVNVVPSSVPVTLDKTIPSGSPQSIATVNVMSTYPDTWTLTVTSEDGFMKQTDASNWLHIPASIGYTGNWGNLANGHHDEPYTVNIIPITSMIGNSGPLDIWFNQPVDPTDPNDGDFKITLTFTGGWL